MDMKIAGSGQIGPGEYDNISISGSGRLCGAIKCKNLSVSGSASGETVESLEMIKISGSCSFSEDVMANNIKIAGSFKCGGGISATGEAKCFGSTKIEKKLKGTNLEVAGALHVNDDIEAESIYTNGKIDCKGLINAENITINVENSISKIGSIGGSSLKVRKKSNKNLSQFFMNLFYKTDGRLEIANEIECDMIDIESVTAPKVIGRIVKIGDDCEIDTVQYSETVDISPKAKVGKTEKI